LLHRPLLGLGLARAHGGPAQHADSRAHGGAGRRIPSGRTDCGPGSRAENRADGSALDRGAGRRLGRYHPTLLQSPLTAHRIIGLELLEVLLIPGEHHDARTGGYRDAACQQQSRRN
jgi:hypothetical protein